MKVKPFDFLVLSIVSHLCSKLLRVVREVNGLCEASRTLFKLNAIPVEQRQSNHKSLEHELLT